MPLPAAAGASALNGWEATILAAVNAGREQGAITPDAAPPLSLLVWNASLAAVAADYASLCGATAAASAVGAWGLEGVAGGIWDWLYLSCLTLVAVSHACHSARPPPPHLPIIRRRLFAQRVRREGGVEHPFLVLGRAPPPPGSPQNHPATAASGSASTTEARRRRAPRRPTCARRGGRGAGRAPVTLPTSSCRRPR